MNRNRNALIAGIFIVVTLVAAVAVILLINGEGSGKTQTHVASFKLDDDLSGLSIGDEVRLGGVKIGVVRDIQTKDLESHAPLVLVTFSMPANYVLRDDAQVGVQAALTGPPNLNIVSVGTGKPLGSSDVVVGIPDPKNTLLAYLREATPHIVQISKKLNEQVLPKVNSTVDSFKSTADSANALVQHIDTDLGESKVDLKETIKSLNQVTANVREKLPPLIEKITSAVDKVNETLTNTRSALEDVKLTAANARDLTASARSVIVDNRGKLDGIIKGLKATSDNLDATSIEVRHSPWRLLYRPSPDEMGNLNLYDTARQFSQGAGNLSDAAQALRDALRDPNVDKAQLQKLMQNLDQSFSSFHLAEDKLWTAVRQ